MTTEIRTAPAMSAPLYTSMEVYPTGPILHFPPPLPVRQSLRSRCGVTMHLQLSTHGLAGPPLGWSPKGHVQPHRNNLPRRRNIKRVVLHDHEEDEVKAVEVKVEVEVAVESPKVQEAKVVPAVHVEPHRNNLPRRRNVKRIVVHDTDEDNNAPALAITRPVLAPIRQVRAQVVSHPPIEGPFVPAIPSDDSHLQLLVPGIFMAFADMHTQADQLPGHTAPQSYTHVVRIGYGEEAAVERVSEGRMQSLYLRLPSTALENGSGRAGLGLTDAQLRAARDFMAEAHPHLSLSPESSSNIRLLVTGPHGRPTDVMCVAACYFSFVTGKSMDDVLRFIDAEDEILSVWKGEVSDDESERVEKIARAWSWLSNIIRPQAFNYSS